MYWRDALESYPYLFSNILWLASLVLILRVFTPPAQRRLFTRVGLLLMTACPLALVAERDYWNPVRIIGGTLGFEDALCSFNIGVTGILLPFLLLRDRVAPGGRPMPTIARSLGVGIPPLCLFFVLVFLGRPSMTSTIVMQLATSVLLAMLRFRLWRFSVTGGIVFPVFYCCFVKTVFLIWPGFHYCWRSTLPWGLFVLGIPLGEIVWATSFGLFWPLFAGYIFDVQLVRPPVRGLEPVWQHFRSLPGATPPALPLRADPAAYRLVDPRCAPAEECLAEPNAG